MAPTTHGRMRLARFLATAGVASRRACEEHIRCGRITVNDRTVETPAVTVDPDVDVIRCDRRVVHLSEPVYLVLHKPRGYTCSRQDAHAAKLVFELLPEEAGRLFTVGRLDRDSEGVLLVTNDGWFAERVSHPRYGVAKRYRVWCAGSTSDELLQRMRRGIVDAGEFLCPQDVRVLERRPEGPVLEFVLTEGRKREIRRLCGRCGLVVRRLVRETVGSVALDNLRSGEWRPLADSERDELLQGLGPREPHGAQNE